MSNTERSERIETYGQGYALIKAALESCPREMWDFKPAPNKWSVREIIIHMADSELHAAARCRTIISEPGKAILGYDQDAYANALCYGMQDIALNLELFRLLRETTYHIIKNLPEAPWANKGEHSEHGWMTLDDWLVSYVTHVEEHVRQIARNLAAWHEAQA